MNTSEPTVAGEPEDAVFGGIVVCGDQGYETEFKTVAEMELECRPDFVRRILSILPDESSPGLTAVEISKAVGVSVPDVRFAMEILRQIEYASSGSQKPTGKRGRPAFVYNRAGAEEMACAREFEENAVALWNQNEIDRS
jgi:predicted ArsR family transcriptional regulator